MNLAFPALVVFVLILPGFILRYTYTSGFWGWSSPTSMRRISDEVAYAVIFALLLHVLWLEAAELVGARPDVRSVLALLSGSFGPADGWYERSLAAIADHRRGVAGYFLSQYGAAGMLGLGLHREVRKRRLDHRSKMFRFDNYWYYMLTGEVTQFVDRASDHEDVIPLPQVDGVYLSATVDVGKDTVLYRGLVKDFTFDRDGVLDTVVLVDAHRRSLSADRQAEDQPEDDADPSLTGNPRYYSILGDYFVLKYAQVRTLNLDYFWVDAEVEIDAPPTGSQPAAEGSALATEGAAEA